MADEPKSELKQVIESLSVSNSLLNQISINADIMSASWGPGSQNEFAVLMLRPMKHSLENISNYTRLMLNDIAAINVLLGATVEGMVGVEGSENKKSAIIGREDYKSAMERMSAKYDKTSTTETEKPKDPFRGVLGAMVSFAADLTLAVKDVSKVAYKSLKKITLSLKGDFVKSISNLSAKLSAMGAKMTAKLKELVKRFENTNFGKKLFGFFDKISAVSERLVSKMEASWKMFKGSKFGKKLFSFFDKIAEMGERMISKFRAGWRLMKESKHFKAMTKAFSDIGKAMKKTMGPLVNGLKKIGSSIVQSSPGLKRMSELIGGFKNKLFGGKEAEKQKEAAPHDKKEAAIEAKPEKSGLGKALDVAKGVGKIGKSIANTIKEVMKSIAEGVGAFGKKEVLKGAAALLILGGALFVAGKGLQEISKVDWEGIAKGAVVLGGLAITAALIGQVEKDMIKGALAIAVLGGALWVAGKGLREFAGIDWETVGIGLATIAGLAIIAGLISLAAPEILIGAVAIAALGGAMWIAAKAFEVFAKSSKDFAAGLKDILDLDMAKLGLLGVGLAVIGPLLIPASIGFGMMGAALLPFAAAMKIAGPGMGDFADGMQKLGDIDASNLLKVAAAITALGAAMAAFGAGQAAAGLGNLVSKFLSLGGDSPVDQLIKIGEAGTGIEKAASGIDKISKAMDGLSKLSKDSMDAINDFPWLKATAFVAAGGEMTAGDVSVKAISKVGAPDTGAQMNAFQSDTAEAQGDVSAAVPAAMTSITGGKKVQNNVNSVTYNNNNIPDRTLWQLTPSYGF